MRKCVQLSALFHWLALNMLGFEVSGSDSIGRLFFSVIQVAVLEGMVEHGWDWVLVFCISFPL